MQSLHADRAVAFALLGDVAEARAAAEAEVARLLAENEPAGSDPKPR